MMGTIVSDEYSYEEEKEDANVAHNVGEALLDNLRPSTKLQQKQLVQSANKKSPQIVINDGPGRDLSPAQLRAPSTTNMPVDLFR